MGVDEESAIITLPEPSGELQAVIDGGGAVAWRQPITIQTYEPDSPDRYPMFLERRVYQGSSGRVYPLPFTSRIASEPRPRVWDAIHLENEFLRLVVLPELGGRIYVGYDKTTGYDFFYRNNVIKPALVGLAGPWVSGGVEFNWPQHHRPGTYLPVDTSIRLDDDGSVIVWCSDHDPFSRMKGMHGVRLRPGRSIAELEVRLFNRTSERHTFLWWANVAARVHDDYQSFFPTDVRYVADHARRAITAFPAADRPYYGVDYPARAVRHPVPDDQPGADRIDFYRNILAPTSYMVVDTQDSFFGGYDHAKHAGFVHWADRRFAPGKKQWTWGNAPSGHAWDALLTDTDGPYVELMAGVFTDNQPDFAWLAPGETKTFSQFWYPISDIGVAHQANLDAAVHFDVVEAGAAFGVSVTRRLPDTTIRLRNTVTGEALFEQHADLAPGHSFVVSGISVDVGGAGDAPLPHELRLTVKDKTGAEVIAWQPRAASAAIEPRVATEPPTPAETPSLDELYLTGVHLAQYRHPTRSPLPYWHEALRRDPSDSRVNLALAEYHYRASDYEAALQFVQESIARSTARNGNPADGGAHYLLGLVLRRLRRPAEAAEAFAKAAWDGKWAHAGFFETARLSAATGDNTGALADAMQSTRLDTDDLRVRALRVILLRRLGRSTEADALLYETLALDPLDVLARALAGQNVTSAHECVDAALDFASMGEVDLAVRLLRQAAAAPSYPAAGGSISPIAQYLLASIFEQDGRADEATTARAKARAANDLLAFPSGLDAHDALRDALESDPRDAQAHSQLGMLLFDQGRHRDAAEHWQRAIELGTDDPVTYRNAGMVAFNVLHDDDLAWSHYEHARTLAPDDARLLYELDQLARNLHHSRPSRLARLEASRSVVLTRDDLTVQLSELLTDVGRAHEAVELLESRAFQPWEGGEGQTIAAWEHARTADRMSTEFPPASLGEARSDSTVPQVKLDDGTTDYFATSLPEPMLFSR